MSAKHLQRELDLGLPAPLNLTECTSFVLSEEKARRRLVRKKIKQKNDPPDKKFFNEAGVYGPTRSVIKNHLKPPWDTSLLDEEEKFLRELALLKEGQAKINSIINADAIASFNTNFSQLQYIFVQGPRVLAIKEKLVTVFINPNLHLIDNARLNLVKLRCAKNAPSKGMLRFIHKSLEITYLSQIEIYQLPLTSVFCIDLASGKIIPCPEPKPFALGELKKALEHYQHLYSEIYRSYSHPEPQTSLTEGGALLDHGLWQPLQQPSLFS